MIPKKKLFFPFLFQAHSPKLVHIWWNYDPRINLYSLLFFFFLSLTNNSTSLFLIYFWYIFLKTYIYLLLKTTTLTLQSQTPSFLAQTNTMPLWIVYISTLFFLGLSSTQQFHIRGAGGTKHFPSSSCSGTICSGLLSSFYSPTSRNLQERDKLGIVFQFYLFQ